MKSTDIEYSIILPCLNEEKTLGICIRKIHQFFSNTGLTYEIIVADNGSTDNSALVAKNNRADVIQVSQKGYGSALRHGIEPNVVCVSDHRDRESPGFHKYASDE